MDVFLSPRGDIPEARQKDLLRQVNLLRVQAEADLRREFNEYSRVVILLCNTIDSLVKEESYKKDICIHNPGV
jgi:hypothetical protein